MTVFLDRYCELFPMLVPCVDQIYYKFDSLLLVPGATYIIGREQLRLNADRVRSMVDQCQVIFSNPAEGSETMIWHLRHYGVEDLVLSGKMKIITGGRMPPEYPYMLFEHFLTQPFRFEENKQATQRTDEIFQKIHKPYRFLCLNGRSRPHRVTLLNELENRNLLDSALWTNLDNYLRPIKLLPPHYEVERYTPKINPDTRFVKHELFNNEWGEIYIRPEPYIDSYFSLVTETVADLPYTFITEKTAKPLAMGHPFVVVGSQHYYRDLRNLGFKTFDSIIDESFDSIELSYERLQRIIQVVDDLCASNLDSFLAAAEPICKYNQQHLQQYSAEQLVELPQRVLKFINE
jgi:hypothetical protein